MFPCDSKILEPRTEPLDAAEVRYKETRTDTLRSTGGARVNNDLIALQLVPAAIDYSFVFLCNQICLDRTAPRHRGQFLLQRLSIIASISSDTRNSGPLSAE